MTKEELKEFLSKYYGINSENYAIKTSYLDKFNDDTVGIFGKELQKPFYFYDKRTESVYCLPYNKNYKSAYQTEVFQGKTKYQVSLNDCVVLSENIKEETNEYTFTITVKVKVKTKLSFQEAVDEFETNSNYEFPPTDNIQVIDTEWIETN